MKTLFATVAPLLFTGCIAIGDASQPIPTLKVPATQPSGQRALIVILPGFGVDAKDMETRDVAGYIHKSWPQADVLLTSATYDYYKAGKLVTRLEDEIIRPARAEGYRQVWLTGASMGGMGALLYERQHPGEVDGLVLLSPFLGGGELLKEIDDAGGVKLWDPHERTEEMTPDNYQRQVWKMIKAWPTQPDFQRRIWLACGTDDALLRAVHLLSPQLLPDHYLERPGRHWWSFFLPAAEDLFGRIHEEVASG